ncbi:hypothetical protein BN2497_6895 [Janthinobacterium sp. CG23_2]|nr:hypothetical protein BN2497_6895 [Janthinobacterium sp. CG23_2]CUU29845.1 hypothetical protein BN3177_6895 [Janthinobacterium sp. CG23_2]
MHLGHLDHSSSLEKVDEAYDEGFLVSCSTLFLDVLACSKRARRWTPSAAHLVDVCMLPTWCDRSRYFLSSPL